ncbi:hypothetical protein ACP70R_040948 [Stipagrostis hirtigluma subsp. patula]
MDYQGNNLRDFLQTNGHQVLQRVDNNCSLRYFTENEIRHITNGYSTMLGQGAFGQVYKGTLDDQSTVAVKRYIHGTKKEEFAKEVIVHSQINHRNVVRLLGCCTEENALMIVMEFISNGNLESILHGSNTDGRVPFPLAKRLNIAIEVAEVLWCMHSMYSPILHGDIKPANILLDENLTPKISDFGIARLICTNGAQYTRNIIGSIGYLDPAYCESGVLTPKSDVYSFGVVLLEIISRKKALDGTIILAQCFNRALEQRENVLYMFDEEINNTNNMKFLGDIANLAAKCLRRDVEMRPEMIEVAINLRLIRKALQGEQGNSSQWHTSLPYNLIPPNKVGSAVYQLGNLNIFNEDEMKMMTRNYSMIFREELRERLYNGILGNSYPVIVKQLRTHSETDKEKFLKSISILSKKNHKNIANVVGFHLGKSISECVYESCCELSQSNDGSISFSNRNLYEVICSMEEFPFHLRLSIAAQCAEGLLHIHSLVAENPDACVTGLSGRLSSTNIFLDKNFVPKIFNHNLSTFLGLSVLQRYTLFAFRYDHGSQKYYSDRRGVSGQLFDAKSDVYSFGVVLLELITWTTVRYMSDGRAQVLTKHFLDAYRENCNAVNIFGNKVYDERISFFVHEAIAIAVECLQLDREKRPELSGVLSCLQSIRSKLVALPTISLDELKERTWNFSDDVLIGKGPYAAVFMAVLKDGQKLAVKKLSPDNEILAQLAPHMPKSWSGRPLVLQIPTISGTCNHDNVVQLLGYFVEGETHVLAYEYAAGGSLHDILHGKKGVKGAQTGPPLSWLQRVKIAIGAAKGLEFLHDKADPLIIHTNIKSSNILLFDDDVAKIGDIGISVKLVQPRLRVDELDPPYAHLPANVGYGAPECTTTGQYSKCSDVYSFGVVLLELLTGRKGFDLMFQPNLSEHDVKGWIDPRLGAYPPKGAAKMAKVAAMCVEFLPDYRPDMSTVVKALSPLLNSTSNNLSSVGEAPGVGGS